MGCQCFLLVVSDAVLQCSRCFLEFTVSHSFCKKTAATNKNITNTITTTTTSFKRPFFQVTSLSQFPSIRPPLVPEEKLWGSVQQGFLWARCLSCHPTNSVKAQKEMHGTNPTQWHDLILSSPITGLLTAEAVCITLCWLFKASIKTSQS